MIEQTTPYGIAVTLDAGQARVIELVRQELSKEGFGVLTEIDIAATLRQKLNVDFPPYVILGACNPPLAHRALLAERDLGLLLPCNVIVYATEDGRTAVAAMDPEAALALTGNEQVREVAQEVRSRLERVLRRLESASLAPPQPREDAARAGGDVRGVAHYDGEHPEEPLPPEHFTEEQRAAARALGDGSPGLDD